jgi:polyvinyl alcohol dehydrogenase (cytochrome)
VFVGSQNGKVYSLDARSGCTYWQFDAGKPVRPAVVIGPRGGGWAAYFGDAGANVYAIDALTGNALWTTKVDQHPAAIVTGGPTLVGTTLFVPVSSFEEVTGAKPSYPCCSFRGSLVALDSSTGKVLWKTFTIKEEVWRTPHPGCGDVPGCNPAQSAAVTAIPGLVFSGGLDGRLRAYFAENGKIA